MLDFVFIMMCVDKVRNGASNKKLPVLGCILKNSAKLNDLYGKVMIYGSVFAQNHSCFVPIHNGLRTTKGNLLGIA